MKDALKKMNMSYNNYKLLVNAKWGRNNLCHNNGSSSKLLSIIESNRVDINFNEAKNILIRHRSLFDENDDSDDDE